MKRLRVGLVFGGCSVEHEVSLVSAKAVLENIDAGKYEVVPIGVNQDGAWLTSGDAAAMLESGLRQQGSRRAALTGDPTVGGLVPIEDGGKPVPLDVVFPLIHGQGGEDGTLQGVLELAGIPYVGSGVLGSSLGMDKAAMKAVFKAAGLACPRHVVLPMRRLRGDVDGVAREISREIGYPCFVKPSNGGSSVGVSKVKSPAGLSQALADAAAYDRRVIVEEAIEGQEIECAVLGNDNPEASVVGEIVPCNEFYDYSAKYLEDGSELIIPARITDEQAREVRRMSIAAFKALDCAGMARVDFFARRSDGAVLINEINTIPGFTPISMYPRLWGACGVSFTELVDRLIALALERHAQKGQIARRYQPRLKAPSHG